MNKLKARLVLAAILALPAAASAGIRVVSTIPSFAEIARRVGGDQVEVLALLDGNRDPHFVESAPSLSARLAKADLLLRAGLGLEDGWLPPLQVASRNANVQKGGAADFDVSRVMQLRDVPRAGLMQTPGDVHPGGNPHYMLDPRNGIVLAEALAERLGKLDPPRAAEFQKRARAYAGELTALIRTWEGQLKAWKGRPVLTYHKSLTYLLAWLGAASEATIEDRPGVPPSPERLLRLVGEMKQNRVRFVLMESHYPRSVAGNLALQSGARLIVIPTEVDAGAGVPSYVSIFERIVQLLKDR